LSQLGLVIEAVIQSSFENKSYKNYTGQLHRPNTYNLSVALSFAIVGLK